MYGEGEYIVDQGLYYPTPMNYGYYYTGFESPGEWDGHHQFLDGQEVQYMGGQAENFPYQYYYTPGYEYAQPICNPYPYGGAVVGSNGAQVYPPHPLYNDYIHSAPYYANAVQPRPDMYMNPAPVNGGLVTNGSVPSLVGSKQNLSSTSAPFCMVSSNPTSKHTPHVALVQDKSKEGGALQRQPQMNDRGSLGASQGANNMSNGTGYDKQLKHTLPVGGVLPNYRPSVYQPVGAHKVSSGFYGGGSVKNFSARANAPGDQTLAQPFKKLDHQLVVKSLTTKAGSCDASGNIIICPDQYHKADFPVEYPSAIFFVIKSYSEDDVHKSIKYNVWSSTPNGNKKLDNAYEDSQRVTEKDSQGCPVFLFFSVNASGNFCGVAEMIGRVDFHKDMDFWQQDKWSGSFPVKWHIIKDVPNGKFRHITLDNNENNPVTYSRDTQEVPHKPGLEVLKIFKGHALRTSLLDDFMYYETREKIMHEDRARAPSKRFSGTAFIPGLDPPPPRKLNYVVDFPSVRVEKVINQNDPKPSEEVVASASGEVYPTNKLTDTPTSETMKHSNAVSKDDAVAKKDSVSKDDVVASLKIGSLTISGEQAKSPPPRPALVSSEPETTFTVGSMPVKISGLKKSSGPGTSKTKPQDARPQKLG